MEAAQPGMHDTGVAGRRFTRPRGPEGQVWFVQHQGAGHSVSRGRHGSLVGAEEARLVRLVGGAGVCQVAPYDQRLAPAHKQISAQSEARSVLLTAP